MARRRPPAPPAEPEVPVDLEARWRHLRWFGMARAPDDTPLEHRLLVARLERNGTPLPEAVAQVEAVLASQGRLEGFGRFHARMTINRHQLTNR